MRQKESMTGGLLAFALLALGGGAQVPALAQAVAGADGASAWADLAALSRDAAGAPAAAPGRPAPLKPRPA
ncbi:hypothetical protein [Ramlibacter sp.]|uniref:hypothetical protein n=1 Tax=Ramlibacter sp. TaxID=1917967 RepID=UPI002D08B513|nr:hypothetical protein [Ramlibacter sp.]HWI81128.1 hypothetical protein [Ramlibacter sp.]